MESEKRNIINYYHYWEHDAIIADLESKRLPYHIMCCNIHGDFNVGTCIRNANAFLASSVLLYGHKKYDKRGTVGTHNYTRFSHVKELESIPNLPLICMDNVEGAVDITTFEWPKTEFIMVFGEEQIGIPQDILKLASKVVYIPQLGSVRSLNVGCASAIAMYDYVSKLPRQVNLPYWFI